MTYLFDERLRFSKGRRQVMDTETIRQMIDGCVDVVVAEVEQDREGIDYIATLRGGAKLFIDAKARDSGCSRFWNNGPELALEDWSIVPENGMQGKAGWTLDESKLTDLVLFTFDLTDTDVCYLLSFQLLRIAFRRFYWDWKRQYKNDVQHSDSWRSHCIFVPAEVVMNAISAVSVGYCV